MNVTLRPGISYDRLRRAAIMPNISGVPKMSEQSLGIR